MKFSLSICRFGKKNDGAFFLYTILGTMFEEKHLGIGLQLMILSDFLNNFVK